MLDRMMDDHDMKCLYGPMPTTRAAPTLPSVNI